MNAMVMHMTKIHYGTYLGYISAAKGPKTDAILAIRLQIP